MEVWSRLPIFYFSNPLCVIGSGELVPFPAATRQLDYECELAVVVAREGSNILEADADAYIAGFTIFNDWSCRDLQFDESTFGLGPAKGKDAASSLGPWIVTRDEMAPYYRNGTLHVQCTVRVNGVVWMTGNAWNMHHTFGAMLERAAQDSRIVPGDVLATGTVGGGSISEAVRKGFPARFLQPGDVVEMEVEGIGVLRNTLGPTTNLNRDLRFTAPTERPLPEPLAPDALRFLFVGGARRNGFHYVVDVLERLVGRQDQQARVLCGLLALLELLADRLGVGRQSLNKALSRFADTA